MNLSKTNVHFEQARKETIAPKTDKLRDACIFLAENVVFDDENKKTGGSELTKRTHKCIIITQ